MIGAGIQGGGLTLSAVGDPETPAAPATALEGAPFLNTRGNYQLDPVTGDVCREGAGMHAVLMTARTQRGSAAADPGLGVIYPRKITSSFENEQRQAFNTSLAAPVADGLVNLEDVTIEVHSYGRVEQTIQFRDPATDKPTVIRQEVEE
jgi:hypothetical protein